MFKGFKVKQMAVLANQLVTQHQEAFDKFNTEITITAKTNHMCVLRDENEVEYIIPYGYTGSSTYRGLNINGPRLLKTLDTVQFCMNSIYLIAKELKKDPMVLLEEVITDFAQNVSSYKMPEDRLKVLHPRELKKKVTA